MERRRKDGRKSLDLPKSGKFVLGKLFHADMLCPRDVPAQRGTAGSSLQNFLTRNELERVIAKNTPTRRLTGSSGGIVPPP